MDLIKPLFCLETLMCSRATYPGMIDIYYAEKRRRHTLKTGSSSCSKLRSPHGNMMVHSPCLYGRETAVQRPRTARFVGSNGVCTNRSHYDERVQRAGMVPGAEKHLFPLQEERADQEVRPFIFASGDPRFLHVRFFQVKGQSRLLCPQCQP